MFWYQRPFICVKWGKKTSQYFGIINGVRQGGVRSPQLFATHMDDLSVCSTQCKAGCHLYETVTNHVRYAGDNMFNGAKRNYVCYEFNQSNDFIFNHVKSQCMVFKPIISNSTAQLRT